MIQKKAKILFILHLPPPVHGSSIVGKYIKNSSIINSSFESTFINLSSSFSISEIGKYNIHKIFRFIKIYFQAVYQNFMTRYDLCYLTIAINGKAFYRDLMVVFIIKLLRRKIVLHLHNKGASNFSNIFRKFGYKYVFKNTYVILLSELLYNDIKNYVRKEQLYICPNGIPHTNHSSIEYKKTNTVNLLFLSNIMKTKGVYVLLEACTILKEKKKNFICHFVGGWKDITKEEALRFLVEKGLEDHVYFHGPKYDNEKHMYFENADVFVFPTHYEQECFPLVLLEASQFSLPVLSTFEGGIADIVLDGETGFLCKQKDVNCIVEKLELLIDKPELRTKMGIAGRKRFEENFTLEHFEKRFVNILEKIIDD